MEITHMSDIYYSCILCIFISSNHMMIFIGYNKQLQVLCASKVLSLFCVACVQFNFANNEHFTISVIKVPKQQPKKKCDPVNLYHYYTTLWDKYKSNVPGENNWADLRWSIRQKMAGNIVKHTSSNKV